jgi:dTDP-4-dehydrorhamnose reductase
MTSILLVGVDGFLGKDLFFELRNNKNVSVTGTSKSQKKENIFKLDLSMNPSTKDKHLQEHEIFIFLPAITKTLEINRDPLQTKQINLIQSMKWIEFLAEKGSKVIFPSSSAVYGNSKALPLETDKPNPNSYYGELKLEAENSIINSDINYLIMRITKVVSQTQPLFCFWRETLQANESILAFRDTFISPIHLSQAVHIIKTLALESTQKKEVINISGRDNISYFEYATMFAMNMCASIDLVKKVPVDKNLVSHQLFANLNVEKAVNEFGFEPPTAPETLRLMIEEI